MWWLVIWDYVEMSKLTLWREHVLETVRASQARRQFYGSCTALKLVGLAP